MSISQIFLSQNTRVLMSQIEKKKNAYIEFYQPFIDQHGIIVLQVDINKDLSIASDK